MLQYRGRAVLLYGCVAVMKMELECSLMWSAPSNNRILDLQIDIRPRLNGNRETCALAVSVVRHQLRASQDL